MQKHKGPISDPRHDQIVVRGKIQYPYCEINNSLLHLQTVITLTLNVIHLNR